MCDLSSAGNIWDPCLRLVADRGWEVSASFNDPHDPNERALWVATKEGVRLCADNPIELLGLLAVFDARWTGQHEPYWWVRERDRAPSQYRRALDARHAEIDERVREFDARRVSGPDEWEADVRWAVEEYGLTRDAAYELAVPFTVLRRHLEDPRFGDLRAKHA